MPAFVAAAGAPRELIGQLRAAFMRAAQRPWFAPFREALLLQGFAPVEEASYAPLLQWDREARAAGYELPA
jgi:hypothetical protein